MPAKKFDDEIWRAVEEKVRMVMPEAPMKGKVTRVHSNNTVDVKVNSLDFPLEDVPTLNYSPRVGETVVVSFINGHVANPVVVSSDEPGGLDQDSVEAKINAAIVGLLNQDQVTALINSSAPDIANNQINALVPAMITSAIARKISVDEFGVGTGSGRITFGNGFYVEWGSITIINPSAGLNNVAITFTHTFAYTPFVTVQLNSAMSTQWMYTVASSNTTKGFNAGITLQAALTGTINTRWIAIGKRSGY